MASATTRLGVDIGGTFTDVVLEIDGTRYSTKVLTTYAAPEDAIIDGMHQDRELRSIIDALADQVDERVHSVVAMAAGVHCSDRGTVRHS